MSYIDMDNLTPFIPENEGPGLYGWSGIMRGASIIFFAYIGFDAVSTAAQEAKNPQKDMPKGILGSLAVCTVLYILVDRKSVVWGRRESVRGDHGGRLLIKKKKK